MNIHSRLKSFAAVLLAAWPLLTSPAEAQGSDVLYTSFGPGDTFFSNYGIGIEGSSTSFGYFAVAAKFQVGQDGYLDGIQVPMFYARGANSFIFNLCSANNGFPGLTLESFTVSAPPGFGSLVMATSQSHTFLTTGQDYWLEVLPGAGSTAGAWCDFSPLPGLTTDRVMTDNGSGFAPTTYYPLPFTITGEVPEPSTASLLLVGLGFTWARIRKAISA